MAGGYWKKKCCPRSSSSSKSFSSSSTGIGDCTLCLNNVRPNRLQIDISNLANGTCSSCGSFNGSYIVTITGTNRCGLLGCKWELSIPTVCEATILYAILRGSVGAMRWTVSFVKTSNNNCIVQWDAALFAGPQDCYDINVDITGTPASSVCNPVGGIAKIRNIF